MPAWSHLYSETLSNKQKLKPINRKTVLRKNNSGKRMIISIWREICVRIAPAKKEQDVSKKEQSQNKSFKNKNLSEAIAVIKITQNLQNSV